MLPNVMYVVALRPKIKDLLVPFNLCYSRVEMGQSQYGLHHWLSENPERKRCHLWFHRSTLESCSLHTKIRESITASQLVDLYVSSVLSLHGVPLEINSDRGSLFTSRFW